MIKEYSYKERSLGGVISHLTRLGGMMSGQGWSRHRWAELLPHEWDQPLREAYCPQK